MDAWSSRKFHKWLGDGALSCWEKELSGCIKGIWYAFCTYINLTNTNLDLFRFMTILFTDESNYEVSWSNNCGNYLADWWCCLWLPDKLLRSYICHFCLSCHVFCIWICTGNWIFHQSIPTCVRLFKFLGDFWKIE